MKSKLKQIIGKTYSFINFVLDKLNIEELHYPLLLYKKETRSFLKQYGRAGEHYSFKTQNQKEQLSYLESYATYLKHVYQRDYDEIKMFNNDLGSPSLRYGRCFVFFKEGKLLYWQFKDSEANNQSHGGGSLSLTFELNLHHY